MDAGILLEVAAMQDAYSAAQRANTLSKKRICEICVPFRDKYGLSDLDALKLARNEYSLSEMIKLLKIE